MTSKSIIVWIVIRKASIQCVILIYSPNIHEYKCETKKIIRSGSHKWLAYAEWKSLPSLSLTSGISGVFSCSVSLSSVCCSSDRFAELSIRVSANRNDFTKLETAADLFIPPEINEISCLYRYYNIVNDVSRNYW